MYLQNSASVIWIRKETDLSIGDGCMNWWCVLYLYFHHRLLFKWAGMMFTWTLFVDRNLQCCYFSPVILFKGSFELNLSLCPSFAYGGWKESRVFTLLRFCVCVCVLPFYLNNGLSTKIAEYGARIHHQSMWLPGEWRFWSGLGRLYCIFYKKNRVANTSTEREREIKSEGDKEPDPNTCLGKQFSLYKHCVPLCCRLI